MDSLGQYHSNKVAYDKIASEYNQRVTLFKEGSYFVAKKFINLLKKRFPNTPISQLAILDVGVGAGLDLKIFDEIGLQTFGIDISEKMIEVARGNAPRAKYYQGDFLVYDFRRKFNAIYAQAFIHLFPKDQVNKVFDKLLSLLETNGLVHFSTTLHEKPSEGFEEKHDYKIKVKRFRKRWTLGELNKSLLENDKIEIVLQYTMTDPIGKNWVNTIIGLKDNTN